MKISYIILLIVAFLQIVCDSVANNIRSSYQISLNIFHSFFPWCLHCWIDSYCFIFKAMSTNCWESTKKNSREPEKFQANGGWYIPTYVNADLKQYKKDGLLTYMDQLKYQEYEKNTEKWLQNHIVINFDMIHACWRGSPLTISAREYNTLREEDFKTHPGKRNRRISTVVDLWIGLSLYLHFRLSKKKKKINLLIFESFQEL